MCEFVDGDFVINAAGLVGEEDFAGFRKGDPGRPDGPDVVRFEHGDGLKRVLEAEGVLQQGEGTLRDIELAVGPCLVALEILKRHGDGAAIAHRDVCLEDAPFRLVGDGECVSGKDGYLDALPAAVVLGGATVERVLVVEVEGDQERIATNPAFEAGVRDLAGLVGGDQAAGVEHGFAVFREVDEDEGAGALANKGRFDNAGFQVHEFAGGGGKRVGGIEGDAEARLQRLGQCGVSVCGQAECLRTFFERVLEDGIACLDLDVGGMGQHPDRQGWEGLALLVDELRVDTDGNGALRGVEAVVRFRCHAVWGKVTDLGGGRTGSEAARGARKHGHKQRGKPEKAHLHASSFGAGGGGQ